MRTLRLSLAGTVILVLMSSGGLVTLAQEGPEAPSGAPGPPPGPALVSGTERCSSADYSSSYADGVRLGHSPSFECHNEASDPRVSGPSHGELWSACYAPGCIYWGTYEIEGPDGTWTGPWSGTHDETLGLASFLITLEGTGAYEGWSFVAHWQDPGTGTSKFSGLIYEGPLPPWPAE